MTKSAASPPPLRINLFGRFQIGRGDEAIRLPTRQSRLVLAYLALFPRPHPREKLAAVFWPDVPDASARASLRNVLSLLRRKLGKSVLDADRETVQLNPDHPVRVDVLEFKSSATRFLDKPEADPLGFDPSGYTDDLLVDCYEDWVSEERRALRELHLRCLLKLTQMMRTRSEYEAAIDYAQHILVVDPGNERAHQHLMFCHAARGDRSAALKQYEACRRELVEELAVEPSPETERLCDWIRQASSERFPVEASITNLPIAANAFVGRKCEMAAVKDLMRSVRMLTLTGPGGSGKTRLAVQVATDLLDEFPDGVWWVELGALLDPDAVPRAAAKVLGVPEVPNQSISETLGNFLHSRALLLVLDNCEHLVSVCARMATDLLRQCPYLKVLATSRERLDVAGEQIYPVPTLSVPAPEEAVPPEDLVAYEAVDLFVRRAMAANPDFSLSPENAAAVATVCRRLDGLPLAIELAAARANVLTADEMSARLDDAFALLKDGSRSVAPHQRTLRAAIDWSFDLLTGKEQVLLRRLSVFAGGWTLPAAEAVCGGDGLAETEIVDLLSGLVHKSLVEARSRGSETRYGMLETIRQYGRERLLESGELTAVRTRHFDYFLRLVEGASPHMGFMLPDAQMDYWLDKLEPELDNLRTAARWSAEPEAVKRAEAARLMEGGLRLLAQQHAFWFTRGRFTEGRALLAELLDTEAEIPAETRALALLTAGFLACWQGDFKGGRAPLREALELYERLGDKSGAAMATHGLGFAVLGEEGDASRSRSHFEAALRLARQADDRWVMSFALHFLAIVLTFQGEYERATADFEEGNAIIDSLGGHRQATAFALFHLGRIARLQGDLDRARLRHAESLQLFREAGDRRGIGYALTGFAVLAAAMGDGARSARLSGAVAALETVLGPFLEVPLKVEFDQVLGRVRKAIGEEAFDAAAAEGRAMPVANAIDHALAG